MSEAEPRQGPLSGLRVLDCASIFAGPMIGTIMADFGADVLKVEHPRGDTLRSWGWQKNDVSMWWTLCGRNKRSVTLKLSDPEGRDLLLRLVEDADVLIENFRPGTFERWGLAPEVLHERNAGLVIVRVTGFGQTGPYRKRPGFGTLAEAMSGFAHITGWPDGPPTLPSFPLGDAVAALTGCFATMFCLWWRDHGGAGHGQVVDVSILESLFWILGPQVSAYDQLGVIQGRSGNHLPFTAPRGAFLTSDGRWLALSASAQSIAERVMRLVGRPDLAGQAWFGQAVGRLAHVAELNDAIQRWVGERTAEEVLRAFEEAEAAIAPVYSVDDIIADPHFEAREAIVDVPDPLLGSVRMQNMIVGLSETPGSVDFAGPALGEHNGEVLGGRLGLGQEDVLRLIAQGTVAASGWPDLATDVAGHTDDSVQSASSAETQGKTERDDIRRDQVVRPEDGQQTEAIETRGQRGK